MKWPEDVTVPPQEPRPPPVRWPHMTQIPYDQGGPAMDVEPLPVEPEKGGGQ